MHALKQTRGLRGSLAHSSKHATANHLNLRKSVVWSSRADDGRSSDATAALSGRLEELLIFELCEDGGTQYLRLSVRGLYKYAMNVITHREQYKQKLLEKEVAGVTEIENVVEKCIEDATSPSSTDATSPVPNNLDLSVQLPPPHPSTDPSHGPRGSFPSGAAAARLDPLPTVRGSVPPPPPPPTDGPRVSFQGTAAETMSSPLATSRLVRNRSGSVSGTPLPTMPGTAGQMKQAPVTYRERLGAYLHPRDMRRLVTPFSASNEPELIVRRHVMLLNFDPLRAIILRDRLLVLVPDGADSLLVTLENRVRGGAAEVENSIFGAGMMSDSSRLDTSDDIGTSTHSSDRNKSGKGLVSKLFQKSSGYLSKKRHSFTGDDSGTVVKDNAPVAASETADEVESDRSGMDDDMMDDDDEEDEWKEMEAKGWIDLPFELQCVDAVLHVVCGILSEDTADVEDAAHRYIQRLLGDPHGGMTDDPLTIIRAVKDAVQEMRSRVKGFVQSMSRVLDEDEDMTLMNLSRLITNPERFIQPVPPEVLEEESDEPELILEAHLQIGFSLMNALELVQGQVDTASELLDQKLDAVRNRILYANMMLTVASLCVASASLVGSIFGMNLVIPEQLAEDENAFVQTTVGTIVGAFALGGFIVLILIYSGTIPRNLNPAKDVDVV